MTISKKDVYFQYVRLLAGIEKGIDIKLTDTPVDVSAVVDATGIEFVVWCDDVNNEKWDMMLNAAKTNAEMRLDDAGINPLVLKHLDLILNSPNIELVNKITYFVFNGYVDVNILDDGNILYDVQDEYYIIIDGDLTVDGKHTIVKSFKVIDGKIIIYDIYNEMHEIVGDSDIFNVAKLVD